ncbi:MAG: hypothetical protein K2N82_04935 [Lachnospiraceae bacterium]|nr:hypothetical protein [Lachnospiraceae bacterium]
MLKRSKKEKNQGTTMITVVISFALLLLFVTSYFRIQKLSTEMMMDSKDMILNNSHLIEAFYMGETDNQIVADQPNIIFSGEWGSFYVTVTLKRADKEELSGTIYYFDTIQINQ